MSKRKSNRVARRLLGMTYWVSNKRRSFIWFGVDIAKPGNHYHTIIFTPEEIREIFSHPAPWLLPSRCCLSTMDVQEPTK